MKLVILYIQNKTNLGETKRLKIVVWVSVMALIFLLWSAFMSQDKVNQV